MNNINIQLFGEFLYEGFFENKVQEYYNKIKELELKDDEDSKKAVETIKDKINKLANK